MLVFLVVTLAILTTTFLYTAAYMRSTANGELEQRILKAASVLVVINVFTLIAIMIWGI